MDIQIRHFIETLKGMDIYDVISIYLDVNLSEEYPRFSCSSEYLDVLLAIEIIRELVKEVNELK